MFTVALVSCAVRRRPVSGATLPWILATRRAALNCAVRGATSAFTLPVA